jgi:uncharacterized membrane protein
MEGLSDGVFGFAMTLLVVDIAVHPPGTPLEQLLRAWPTYLAYLVSFLTIGAAWLLHVGLTDTVARTDPIFLRLNLLTLLFVVLLPFPTRLVADARHTVSGERVAVTVYGLTLLAVRLMGLALRAYARRENLHAAGTDGEDAAIASRYPAVVVMGYVVAILLGLAYPVGAVTMYLAIAIVLIVPFEEVGRAVFRHSSRGARAPATDEVGRGESHG